MKRILIIVIVVLLIMGCITAFFLINRNKETNKNIIEYVEKKEESTSTNNATNQNSSVYKDYNFDYNENEAFAKVEELSGLTSINQINEKEAKAIYHIDEKNNYSISLRSNIENNNIRTDSEEIAIIKVPNTDENVNAISAVTERINALKGLKNLGVEPYVVEETKGILTVVISKDARNISNLITEVLKVEE